MADPEIIYRSSRLCFKAEHIEPLSRFDAFRIKTPYGNFQMTKSEFYRVFANVVATMSYKKRGLYHYPTVPQKALQFLIK